MKEFIKKHIISLLIFIFAIVEAAYIYYITIEYQALEEFNNSNIEKIDSLINVIENKNDSIIEKIDTITVQIIKSKSEFKKDFDVVSNFSIDSDVVFFANYISEFEGRYSNNDNSESIKNN